MANIDDFKANLIGGGARANQFRVTVTPPPGIAIGLDVRRTSFLVRGSSLPAQTLGEIAIPFRGRSIYIAGDRTFGETWSTTFMNDTDFMIRNANGKMVVTVLMMLLITLVLLLLLIIKLDLTVEHLDRDDTVLKSYIFRSAWPTSVTAIDLTSEEAAAIETFDVQWRYQHFEASAVNF